MKRAELQQYIDAAVTAALADCTAENPLVAWSRFIDHLDMAGRRKIGDDLELTGRNRYTGEIKKRAG